MISVVGIVLREERQVYPCLKTVCFDGCPAGAPLIWSPETSETKWLDGWTKSNCIILDSLIMTGVIMGVGWWELGTHHASGIWKNDHGHSGFRPDIH